MSAVPVDMNIKARWILSMRMRDELLEHHTLVVRDGRILDLLPHAAASLRYAPRVLVERPMHLLMPGLVNAYTRIGSLARDVAGTQFLPDGALVCVANMLEAGITCFCDIGYFPADSARTAAAQGMRALVGLPVAEHPTPWAQNAGEYLTRALRLRDEYKGHPSISMGFAPLRSGALSDATLARMRTLRDELDAAILVSLHESQRDIDDSLARCGMRPIARLEALGLLTPALTAAHAVHLDAADIELAQRTGIGITLCLASDLMRGNGLAPLAALAPALTKESHAADPTGIRVGLGSDGEYRGADQDLWTDIRLLALHSAAAGTSSTAWDVLGAATRGGAGAMGLDAEIGTLEAGKWADLCCIDFGGPAGLPVYDPLHQLVFSGGRDMVSDVWVAGRHLLCERQFTRLDWPNLAARLTP
jgi:5-methylthioadenosine/S-adenosylhomocysteine deaminase